MAKLAIVVLALAFTVIFAKPHAKSKTSEIEHINSIQSSWKAGHTRISGLSKHMFNKLLGAQVPKDLDTLKRKHVEIANDIPDYFDAREAWPDCASISSIKDQGDCGGCWAVAGASAVSDRLCIGSSLRIQVNLSAENLLTCCAECAPDGGCNGGDAQQAWKYIQEKGVVTGGDFASNEGCQPYTFSPTGVNKKNDNTPICETTCTNSQYDVQYDDDLYYGDSYYLLPNDASAIQTDILRYGSAEASFKVYDDFQYYEKGVYVRTTDKTDGGNHAVRVIGWGYDEDSGLDYWLIANSWSTTFGENGLFRIKRGTNECGIEDYVVAGVISG